MEIGAYARSGVEDKAERGKACDVRGMNNEDWSGLLSGARESRALGTVFEL